MKARNPEQVSSISQGQEGLPSYTLNDVAALEARARAMRAVWVRDQLKRLLHRSETSQNVPGLGQAV